MEVHQLHHAAGSSISPHETRGKQHAMPCHDAVAGARGAYIEAAETAQDSRG